MPTEENNAAVTSPTTEALIQYDRFVQEGVSFQIKLKGLMEIGAVEPSVVAELLEIIVKSKIMADNENLGEKNREFEKQYYTEWLQILAIAMNLGKRRF